MSRTRTTDTLTRLSTEDLKLTFTNPRVYDVWVGNFGIRIPAGGSVEREYSMEFGGLQSVYVGKKGTILDHDGPVPSTGIQYNAVTHTKEEASCPSESWARNLVVSVTNDAGEEVAPILARVTGQVACGDFIKPAPPSLLGAEALINRATSQMRPGQIRPVLDLPRFIAELKDFKDIYTTAAHSLQGTAKNFLKEGAVNPNRSGGWLIATALQKQLSRFIRSNSSKVANALAKGPISAMASYLDLLIAADLTYKFAIAPFLKDIQKLTSMMDQLDKTYNSLASPKPFVVRGSASDQATSTPITTNLSLFQKQVAVTSRREVITWARCLRQPLVLNQWETFRATYGLNFRVRVIWELIPLSFVLDEFVNIGRFLGQFDPAVITLPFSVLESGASVKEVNTYVSSKTPFAGSGTPWIGNSGRTPLVGHVTEQSYIRTPMELPFDTGAIEPIQLTLPNLGQAGTLAELIYATLRRS